MATQLIVPVAKIGNVREHSNAAMLGIAEILGYQMVVGLVEDQNGSISRRFLKDLRDEKGKRIPVMRGKVDIELPYDNHEGSREYEAFYYEGKDGVKHFILNESTIEEVKYSFLYKEGDLIVYFPADTVITDEWADKFGVKSLLKGGNRVGKIALRGEPSFGLVVKLPEGVDWKEGDNVADYYGATKWEPPVKARAGDAAAYDSNIDPYFDKFTDIQNGRLFTSVFKPMEEVVASEKLHGCLHADTMVMLANGEELPISELIKGDMVMACSGSGEVLDFVPREVLHVICLPPVATQKWVKLHFGSSRSVVCTEDHLFLTKNRGWVPAGELSEKDDIVAGF